MIEINNLTKFSLNEKKIKKVLEKAFRFRKINLSIAFVGPGTIKKINKKYRNKDKATDVLSFAEFKNEEKNIKIKKPEEENNLGEIIICPQEVKKNAKNFKTDFSKEIYRVLIHGILHLLGYDHEKTKNKARLMNEKQDYYFKKIINK